MRPVAVGQTIKRPLALDQDGEGYGKREIEAGKALGK